MNVERMKRYRKRTMSRPPETYVLTPQEQEWQQEWQLAWERNAEAGLSEPPVLEWHRQVRAYCRAKGLRPNITIDGRPRREADPSALPPDRTVVLQWTALGESA